MNPSDYRLVSINRSTGTTSRWEWTSKERADKLMSLAKSLFPRASYKLEKRHTGSPRRKVGARKHKQKAHAVKRIAWPKLGD